MVNILASSSFVLMVVAFLIYNWQVFRGRSTPNATSWFVWSAAGMINAGSYFIMTADIAKSITSMTDTLLCVSVFVLGAFKKKFAPPQLFDYIVLCGVAMSGIIWAASNNADTTNLSMQLVAFTGVLPTLYGIKKGSLKEPVLPWLIWTISYILNFLVVCLAYNGNWHELAYPVITGMAMHGTTMTMIIIKNKNARLLHRAA